MIWGVKLLRCAGLPGDQTRRVAPETPRGGCRGPGFQSTARAHSSAGAVISAIIVPFAAA